MTAENLSIRSTNWASLEIVSKSQKGNDGFVEFKACYFDDVGTEKTHHEHSRFSRINGRWFYTTGEVVDTV